MREEVVVAVYVVGEAVDEDELGPGGAGGLVGMLAHVAGGVYLTCGEDCLTVQVLV